MQWFMMVNFGVPVREQECMTKEGIFEEKESKKSFSVLRKMKRGEIPQGAKPLHLGGLVFPGGGFVGQSWMNFSWVGFGEL
jgi:hypothetical protein